MNYYLDFARVGGFYIQTVALASKTASFIEEVTFTARSRNWLLLGFAFGKTKV